MPVEVKAEEPQPESEGDEGLIEAKGWSASRILKWTAMALVAPTLIKLATVCSSCPILNTI
jgi:hypothetical protein